MDEKIKKAADSGDKSYIKFLFADCFAVDPTFEDYQEAFDYCRSKGGLFDAHKELTPKRTNPSDWNRDYWQSIKSDFEKNSSVERLNHMRDVAKVVFAEKVERLRRESIAAREVSPPPVATSANVVRPTNTKPQGKSRAELQQEELEKARRELEEENQRIAAEEAAAKKKALPQQPASHSPSAKRTPSTIQEENFPILLLAVVAIVIIGIVIILAMH